MRVVGLLVAIGSAVAACASSSDPSGGGTFDAGSGGGFDGASADSGSHADAAAAGPFEGVWQGTQSGATIEIANAAGCSVITTSVGGTVCDECVGTYGADDAGVASATVMCTPQAACSVSPAHTSAGTFTRSGTTLTFFYDFGGGTATVEAQLTQETPPDVCKVVDAGGD